MTEDKYAYLRMRVNGIGCCAPSLCGTVIQCENLDSQIAELLAEHDALIKERDELQDKCDGFEADIEAILDDSV